MAAPTVVSRLASVFNAATSPKTAGAFICATGDVLACKIIAEGDNFVPAAPTGVAGGTFTQAVDSKGAGTGNNARATIYTVTVPSSQTVTVSETPSTNTGDWGIEVVQYSGSTGVGAVWSSVASVNGAPSATATPTGANSALEMAIADWNAAVTTGKTYLTTDAGAFTETTSAQVAAHYTYYLGRYADSGSLASKTVGMSAPTGQLASLAAVEVLGSGAGGGGTVVSPLSIFGPSYATAKASVI